MKTLNIFAPINSLGYGVVGKNILKALFMKHMFITLTPVYGNMEISTQEEKDIIGACYQAADHFNKNNPSLLIWHAHEQQIFCGNPRIGMPIFEITAFTPRETNSLKQLDYVAVMSHWAKEVIVNNDIKPEEEVFIFPGGVDPVHFNPHIKPAPSLTNNAITFLSSGKFEKRKGHSLVLRCFVRAFENKPDLNVRLLTHWPNPFMKDFPQMFLNTMGRLGFSKTGISTFRRNNMVIENVDRVPTQNDVASVYAAADIGIFPYSAEGWNLPLIEMMAMGKPCIATNYSAPTEYLTENNAILLNDFKMETAFEERWFPHGIGEWAVPNEDEIIEKMIYCVENLDKVRKIGNKAAVDIKSNWAWEKSAEKIISVLENL